MAIDDQLRHLDPLLDQLTQLSESEISPDLFWPAFLPHACRLLPVLAGAVYVVRGEQEIQLVCECGVAGASSDAMALNSQLARAARNLLHQTKSQQSAGSYSDAIPVNVSTRESPLIWGVPIQVVREIVALWVVQLDLEQRDMDTQAVLSTAAELAAGYWTRQCVAELRAHNAASAQLLVYSQRVHANLDLTAAAFAIANESRQLLECDRVTVAIWKRRRVRILAVSGVDTPDRQSRTLRELGRLVTAMVQGNEEYWYGDGVERSVEVNQRIERYLDTAHPRTLGILPILAPCEPSASPHSEPATADETRVVGAMVIEDFRRSVTESTRSKAKQLTKIGGSALYRALTVHDLPFLPTMRRLARARNSILGDQWKRTCAAMLAIGALSAFLGFYPARLELNTTGQLQPASKQHVFAPRDADIVAILVQHDDSVLVGQPLLQLRSSALELELRQLEGEGESLRERLLAVEAARVTGSESARDSQNFPGRLSSLESEIRQSLETNASQLAILKAEHQALQITSPITGRVLTWDTENRLRARPVQRGEILLSVADTRGDWVLQLDVPESAIGHVIRAQQQLGPELPVVFVLVLAPHQQHVGKTTSVARTMNPRNASTSETNEMAQGLVTALVDVTGDLADFRAGASVNARIDCGTHPIGYVWFHDVLDTVRANWWF